MRRERREENKSREGVGRVELDGIRRRRRGALKVEGEKRGVWVVLVRLGGEGDDGTSDEGEGGTVKVG
jgi:hypothetical protein